MLPGTYSGTRIVQADTLGALRIVSRDGPAVTTITGGIRIHGEAHPPGEIWIEGFTFDGWGNADSNTASGWGVVVDSWSEVDVRIEGNIFPSDSGRGAIGLLSSTVRLHFHAVVARNVIVDQDGPSALLVDIPADNAGDDHCVRIENNLLAGNRSATGSWRLAW